MTIKNRNPILAAVLSIVTCGIYYIYWAFCAAREAASVKDANDSGILEFILMLISPLTVVGYYLIGKKFHEGCEAKGIEHKDNTILLAVLGLIITPVAVYLLQSDLNKLADAE